MKRVVVLLLLLGLVLGGRVLASFLVQYGLDWHAIAGGGGHSTSAGYALDGTLGQAAAGSASSAGYQLGAGFAYGLIEAPPAETPTPTATGQPSSTPTRTATPTGTPGAPQHPLYLPVVVR